MAASDGKGLGLLADFPDVPDTLMRVLNMHNFVEYTNYYIQDLKKYMGEPRKHVKFDRDLFESWRKKGEIIKESYRKMDKNQQINTPDTFAPQHKLTEEFVQWNINKFNIDMQSFFYFLCMGKEPARTWEHRYFINENGNKVRSEKPYFQEQIDSLLALIEFIEVIFGAGAG